MRKTFTLFFLICVLNSFSQTQALPYLNASRGNEAECIIDKDTNVYLFRFNQLEKYNKNMQSIWVKRYDSLTFSNILLSKTNALFFIANTNCVGKMDTAGNIVWCKKTNLTFINFMLDHSNNLMLMHSSGLFKIDTIGNVLYCKKFTERFDPMGTAVNDYNLIDDSLGVYEIMMTHLSGLSNVHIYKFKYSEALDSIISIKIRPNFANFASVSFGSIFISRLFPNTFYLYCRQYLFAGGSGNFSIGVLEKHVQDTIVYSIKSVAFNGSPPIFFNNITDDDQGNVYFSQSRDETPFGINYTNGYYNDIYKIDARGTTLKVKRLFNDNLATTSNTNLPFEKGTFHYLYNNHFVFDYVGHGYSLDTPVLKTLDSTVSTICSNSFTTLTFSNTPSSFINEPLSYSNMIISSDSSYTIINKIVNSTLFTNFTADTNYCLTVGLNTFTNVVPLTIYPNPANDILNIENLAFNNEPYIIELINTLGEIVLTESSVTQSVTLKTSNVLSGMYYISIKVKNKTVTQKISIQK